MITRVITNIADVFCAKINNYKIYLQYVANDLSQLNSDVVRVFKIKYPIKTTPDLSEVINGDWEYGDILEYNNKKWIVYYKERDTISMYKEFDDEKQACEEYLKRLKDLKYIQ